MIWALVREQVRSQRRYTLATAALVAVAVAGAAYAGFLAVTLTHTSAAVDSFYGSDRDTNAYVTFGNGAEFTDVTSNIDAANAAGHEALVGAAVVAALAPRTAPLSRVEVSA